MLVVMASWMISEGDIIKSPIIFKLREMPACNLSNIKSRMIAYVDIEIDFEGRIGVVAKMVDAVTPQHKQAVLYRASEEQSLAYAGTPLGISVCWRFLRGSHPTTVDVLMISVIDVDSLMMVLVEGTELVGDVRTIVEVTVDVVVVVHVDVLIYHNLILVSQRLGLIY
jgi:hypothetical protein